MRQARVIRNRDDALMWSAYFEHGTRLTLPFDVQRWVNDGDARIEFRECGPSAASRTAALPIRAFDWALRKAFRL